VELGAPLKVRMRRTEVRPKPDDSRRAFHLQSGDYPKDYTGLFPTTLVARFAKKPLSTRAYGLNHPCVACFSKGKMGARFRHRI
jgi:hypothetical protein